MGCIGELTEEYRRRMYELLSLYARPYNPKEPVICASSSASASRAVPPTKPSSPARSPLGKDDATLPSAASSGRSRARTRTESCADIMFRN
jgi:hypothetical protein